MKVFNELPVGCLAGGVVTVVNPDALPFAVYFGIVTGGASVLGIGRGLALGKR